MDSYKRSYITLNILDREGTNGGTAKGYVKVEKRGEKGAITFYVEGLENNLEYSGFMISIKDESIEYVDCGGIRIDSGGIGSLKKTFDASNIDGKGFDIYEISAVGLITPEHKIPVIGYTTEEIPGIRERILSRFMKSEDLEKKQTINMTEGKNEEEPQEKITKEDEAAINEVDGQDEETVTPMQEENSEKKGQLDVNSSKESPAREEQMEGRPAETNSTGEKSVTHRENTGLGEGGFLENAGNINGEIDGYMVSLKKYVGSIVNYLQEVKPFEWDLPGYRWWRIDLSFTDSVYDHYLVGFYYEGDTVKYLVYGMPGRFCIQEQPFGGMTGFVYWQPVKGQERIFGEDGYWLLHIDAATGRIAVPLMPTPPPLFS